jgi:hypothetical protein
MFGHKTAMPGMRGLRGLTGRLGGANGGHAGAMTGHIVMAWYRSGRSWWWVIRIVPSRWFSTTTCVARTFVAS